VLTFRAVTETVLLDEVRSIDRFLQEGGRGLAGEEHTLIRVVVDCLVCDEDWLFGEMRSCFDVHIDCYVSSVLYT